MYYNTSYGRAIAHIEVMCSHEYNSEGSIIQEAIDSQNKIIEYTCKYCGEKMRKEIYFDENKVITLPSSLTQIGSGVFINTDIQAIRIPSSVKNVATDAIPSNVVIILQEGASITQWFENNGYRVVIE